MFKNLKYYPFLETLDLSENKIEDVGDVLDLICLAKLTHLNLSANKFTWYD